MHVHFKVHGAGKKNLHGDGIALWYTRDRLVPGGPCSLRDHCSAPGRWEQMGRTSGLTLLCICLPLSHALL